MSVGLKGHRLMTLQDLLKPCYAYTSLSATTCRRVGTFQQHDLWKLPLPAHTFYITSSGKWATFRNSSNKHTFYVGITLPCSMPIIPWLLTRQMDTLILANLTKPRGYHISLLSKYVVWACILIPPQPPPPLHQHPKYAVRLPQNPTCICCTNLGLHQQCTPLPQSL
jgi:hypothetical protein